MVSRTAARLVSLTASIGVAAAAFLGAPTACTTFTGEPTDDGGADAREAGTPSPDAGSDGTVTPPPGEDCRAPCPSPLCETERFDGPPTGWSDKVSSGEKLAFPEGMLLSQVADARGYAYLSRTLVVAARTRIRFSVAVIIDKKPDDGTSLAKVVDGAGNEANIQFDGVGVHACVHLKGTTPVDECTIIEPLAVGRRTRLTLDADLFSTTATSRVSLSIDCQKPGELELPAASAAPSSLDLHVGLEGAGIVRYDDLDLAPAK